MIYALIKGRKVKIMLQEEFIKALEQLKSGEIKEYKVSKEDFLTFRLELVKEKTSSITAVLLKGAEELFMSTLQSREAKGTRT